MDQNFFSSLDLFLSCAPESIQINFCLDYPTYVSNEHHFKRLRKFKLHNFSSWKEKTLKAVERMNVFSAAKMQKIDTVLRNGKIFAPVIASDLFRILGVLNSEKNSTWAYCDIDTFCEWTKKLLNPSLHKNYIFHHWFSAVSDVKKDTLIRLESTNDFLIWNVKQLHECSNFVQHFLVHLFDQGFVQDTPQGHDFYYTPIDDQFLMYHLKFCAIAQENQNVLMHKGGMIKFFNEYKKLMNTRVLRSNTKYLIHTTGPGKLNAVVEKAKQNQNFFQRLLRFPSKMTLLSLQSLGSVYSLQIVS